MSQTLPLGCKFKMNQHICMLAHMIIFYNHFSKIVFRVNENRDKAKQRLVALDLAFTRKIAQAQNLICCNTFDFLHNIKFGNNYFQFMN